MVKSWVCPRCLGDLNTFYVEEGDTMVSQDELVCPNCGYTLHGAVGECCKEESHDHFTSSGGSTRKRDKSLKRRGARLSEKGKL